MQYLLVLVVIGNKEKRGKNNKTGRCAVNQVTTQTACWLETTDLFFLKKLFKSPYYPTEADSNGSLSMNPRLLLVKKRRQTSTSKGFWFLMNSACHREFMNKNMTIKDKTHALRRMATVSWESMPSLPSVTSSPKSQREAQNCLARRLQLHGDFR